MADFENISGFWSAPCMFHMYHERTHTTLDVAIPGADESAIYDGAELEDLTMETMERFAISVKDKPDWAPLPMDTQRGLAPHLRGIEESKRRRRETNNPMYVVVR